MQNLNIKDRDELQSICSNLGAGDTKLYNIATYLSTEPAREGLWSWDMRTNSLELSRMWFEMLDYNEGEIPACVDTWVDLVHPDDREFATSSLYDHVAGLLESYCITVRLRSKSGIYSLIRCAGEIVERDENGTPTRMTGTHNYA